MGGKELSPSMARAPTAPEFAVKVVKENDPANLPIGDCEFILKFRDVSPENKDAADKVWQAIQNKHMGGKTKLKISIKVISASKDTVQGAITEENQSVNQPDIRIVMQKLLLHPPAAGSTIEVLGVMTSYTPQPFMFVMGNGELVSA